MSDQTLQQNPAAQNNGPPPADRPLSLSDRVRSLRLPERQAGTSGAWLVVPWVLCFLLAGSTAFFALRNGDPEKSKADIQDQNKSGGDAAKLPADKSEPRKDEIAHESKGYIIPISLIQISPLIGGKVVELHIEEGDRVAKGKVLAVLEKDEYQADFDHAVGAIKSAARRIIELTQYRKKEEEQLYSEWQEAEAQLVQLKKDHDRNVHLKNQQAVAARDFELAESSWLAMKNKARRLELAHDLMIRGPRDERIAAAEGDLNLAWGDFDKAEFRLDNCVIKAPVDGIILTKKAELHNRVNPSAFSNGLSASLCEMADLTELEVDLSIAERDIARLFKFQDCKIWAEAFPDRFYQGYVSRLMPQADRAKGAVPVRVVILGITRQEEGKYLRPDMGAIVTFFNRKIDRKLVKAEHQKSW
jgi:multidrug resistance efflux pump